MVIIGGASERCVQLAQYMLENQTTVRGTARRYGISKSTVYKDITEKLSHINPALCTEVKRLLDINKAERHLRGGEATRRKYRCPEREPQENASNG